MAPFSDARFGRRWVGCSKLSEDDKVRGCETIKRLVTNAALQLYGSDRLDKIVNTVEASAVMSSSNVTNSLKRKTPFVFPTDGESRFKRTRSSALEQVEEKILLFSREAADDSTVVFRKSKTYPFLSMLALPILYVPATSAPVERVFSTSAFIIRPHRGTLTKDMLVKLTFLKWNCALLQ